MLTPGHMPGADACPAGAALAVPHATVTTLAAALWPGLGTANPDAHLPDGFVGQRLAFTVAELVPPGPVLLAAFLLARTRRPPAR
jgi:hypothetical protein